MPFGSIDKDTTELVVPAQKALDDVKVISRDEFVAGEVKPLKDAEDALFEELSAPTKYSYAGLGKENPSNVPKGGFKSFDIEAKKNGSNQKEVIGEFRSIEYGADKKPKLAVISTLTHPQLFTSEGKVDASKLQTYIESKGGSEIAFAVAGATSTDRDDMEGAGVVGGKNVGNSTQSLDKMGALIVNERTGEISMTHDYEVDEKDESALINKVQKQGNSLIQLYSYIRNGKKLISQKREKDTRRFIVERTVWNSETKNVEDKTYGIIDFDVPMTYAEAVYTMEKMNRPGKSEITRAYYMDGGPVSEEYDYSNPKDFGNDGYVNLVVGFQ